MSLQTSRGFAGRLGYGLGRAVRFMLFDTRVIFRSFKRAIFTATLFLIAIKFGRDLVSLLIPLVLLCVGLIALASRNASDADDDKDDLDIFHQPNIPYDGPDGYGYYDGYGNFRGSSNPCDD